MRKILLFLILFLNIYAVNSYAISAKSAVLIDGESGRVLYKHNAYEKLPMASTTKIMTGLLSCESGKLEETVKVSSSASGTEGSSLWLKIGETLTLEELTYGLMLKSGNDAAVAIAEHIGGNVKAFTALMNKRAKEIGAVNTNFENPHGLDSEGHYTTAYDLAQITREAMKNEKFREIVSTKTYSIPMQGEKWDRALKNHNKMLWNYEGCIGVKTGFTKKSKRCLVTCAQKENQILICVTLNASDDWNDHKYLLDYGVENYDKKDVVKKGEKAIDFMYDKKNNRSVEMIFAESFSVSAKDEDVITIEKKNINLSIPSEKGTCSGIAEIFCNGEKIGEVKLVTNEAISELNVFEKIKNWFKNFNK